MTGLDIAFRDTKCVAVRIDLTKDLPLTILGKYPDLPKKDRHINLREIVLAEDFPLLADAFDEIVSGRQKNLNIHCRLQIGNDFHWIYFSCSVKKDTFNRSQHLTGTAMDVSDYLGTADSDLVIENAERKNRETIANALKSSEAELNEILGTEYLERVQRVFTENGISSAFYNEQGKKLALCGTAENHDELPFSKTREIRANHKTLANWTIAASEESLIDGFSSLHKILAETISKFAGAILMLYNEMENSKKVNRQLGSGIEQQILLNNIYNIILEKNDAAEALKMVIKLVGEFMKLDRIALYAYSEDGGETRLSHEWNASGIVMERRFSPAASPRLVEELNYCDTYFSSGGFEELEDAGIKSFVASRVSENGKSTGMIFYESIHSARSWTSADKKIFRNISQIISTMLIRCNMDEELRRRNSSLKEMAFTDPILGISSRACLDRDLENELSKGVKGASVSVRITSTNILKKAFGHTQSDALLKKIAKYIDGMELKGKRVYRFSGNILMIILRDAGRSGVEKFLKTLSERLAKGWFINDEEYFTEMTAGVAFYPDDGNTCEEIYKASTIAMYCASNEGSGAFSYYSSEFERAAEKVFDSRRRLRKAVLGGMEGFTIKYQPVIDCRIGEISALEASVLWRDGKKGEISADAIVKLAEGTGIDEIINRWLIERSCEFLKEVMLASGRDDVIMKINFALNELYRFNANDILASVIEKNGLKGKNIAIEIPESVQLKAGGASYVPLEHIRKAGATLVTDNFGGEYTSLSVLKNELLSCVNISASSLVRADDYDRKALRSVISLAHSRGVKIAVKNIETKEQLKLAEDFDADYFQGGYFAPAEEAEKIINLFSVPIEVLKP